LNYNTNYVSHLSQLMVLQHCSKTQKDLMLTELREFSWLLGHKTLIFTIFFQNQHTLFLQLRQLLSCIAYIYCRCWTLLRLLFHVPTLVSAIGHSQLLDHSCGTAFRPKYDSPTLPFISSAGHKRCICLVDWDSNTQWLFVCSMLHKCSYLLTYIQM